MALFNQKISVKRRVRNGARYLDENFPGWANRINIDTLRLSNCEHCICGQLFEDKVDDTYDTGYDYAHNNLFSEANSWIHIEMRYDNERAVAVARFLGFQEDVIMDIDGQTRVTYDDLEKAWKKLLKERQELEEL